MRKKITMLSLVLAIAMSVQGCYGSFLLERKLWKWNGTMGNKWANEAVFLICNILPVYAIAGFADVIFLNLVEFWSGKNPMAFKSMTNGTQQAVLKKIDETHVSLVVFEKNDVVSQMNIERMSDGSMIATDLKTGACLGAATIVNGQFTLVRG